MDYSAAQEALWAGRADEVGARVREARERAGLTQAQLAESALVSRGYVQFLEAGAASREANPRLRTLYALADSLGVSVVSLLPADASRPPAV